MWNLKVQILVPYAWKSRFGIIFVGIATTMKLSGIYKCIWYCSKSFLLIVVCLMFFNIILLLFVNHLNYFFICLFIFADCLTISVFVTSMKPWSYKWNDFSLDFFNNSNYPRMCVLRTLCGNVYKQSIWCIYIYINIYIYSFQTCCCMWIRRVESVK